jgi:ABC-type transport system involved in multi-copper enzyme maturation permease subunit
MGSLAALFWFSVRQALWQRKIWPTLLLLAAPSVVTVLVRSFESTPDDLEMYHAPIQFILLSLVLPLICMLFGTSLIGSDIEGRTLVYLLTRRMRRATVLLVRFLACALVLSLLFELAVLAVHACAVVGLDVTALEPTSGSEGTPWDPARDLAVYVAIIPLGVVVFLAIFTCVGLLASKPLSLSVGYFVVIELILAAIPVAAQKYTIAHQLRATMYDAIPRLKNLWDIPRRMLDELYPPGDTGTTNLVVVTLVALLLACVLATLRELTPSKVARE